jgi:hypothetical protein
MTKVTSFRKTAIPFFTPFGWPVISAWGIEKFVTIDGVEDPAQTEIVANFKAEAVADQALSTLSAFQTTTGND